MLCALLQHPESRGSVRLGGGGRPQIEIDYLAEARDVTRYREGMRSLARIAAQMDHGLLAGWDVSQATLDRDELLDRLVSERVQTAHHPMGTARMGAAHSRDGVVAPDLSVHGVLGLWVADASVIPLALRSNIHLTCLVIGAIAGERLQEAAR